MFKPVTFNVHGDNLISLVFCDRFCLVEWFDVHVLYLICRNINYRRIRIGGFNHLAYGDIPFSSNSAS